MSASSSPVNTDMTSLLEKELKASDDRYLHVRSQLLEAFTSNAQMLEYTQYVEDQLAFYKRKALMNEKKNEIEASSNVLPPLDRSPTDVDRAYLENESSAASLMTPRDIQDFPSDQMSPTNSQEMYASFYVNLPSTLMH